MALTGGMSQALQDTQWKEVLQLQQVHCRVDAGRGEGVQRIRGPGSGGGGPVLTGLKGFSR